MKEVIKAYIKKKMPEDAVLHDGDDIFEKGFVNSMFALQLVMFLEKEFSIAIGNEDLKLTNFNTVTNIDAFVSAKKAAV